MICPERTEASFTEKENTRRIIERISALNQPILFRFLVFSLPYFQTNNITILNINMVKIEKVKVREKKKRAPRGGKLPKLSRNGPLVSLEQCDWYFMNCFGTGHQ